MLRERRSSAARHLSRRALGARHSALDPKLAREYAGQAETMFALSNGYLGIRGTPDEGAPGAGARRVPQRLL